MDSRGYLLQGVPGAVSIVACLPLEAEMGDQVDFHLGLTGCGGDMAVVAKVRLD